MDGPFAETRELVPGFEAEDFGEAISPETGALERRLRERLKGTWRRRVAQATRVRASGPGSSTAGAAPACSRSPASCRK